MVQLMHGIHLLRFTAFECTGYQVGWDEADYPTDCEDFLIEREFRKLKRCHPDPVDLSFPCMHGCTDFHNPAHPACLDNGIIPLRPCRLSPERRVHFPSYRAYYRARGHHIASDRHINRWPVSPTHGSTLPAMPSPRHCSPSPLPTHHSKSTSSYVGSLLLVLVLLLVFIVVNLAIPSGNAMTIADPALPILHRNTQLQLLLLIHYLFLTGHLFLAIPPSTPGHFQS